MTTSHGRPTLQQVASRAGVSRSTAGAALAGSPRVSARTAQKVREAARTLGYRTEFHARVLRRGGPELANVVLDTRLTHTSDGAIHPFWARLLTGFVTRMQSHDWLCIVQFQDDRSPVLDAPAPGLILATTDVGTAALFMRDAFGQTLISPVGGSATETHRALQHDYAAIGVACARHLHASGCRHVLLVGRTGFDYSDTITRTAAEELEARGTAVSWATSEGSVAERISSGLTADVDGLLDLSADPAALAQALQARTVVPASPQPGEIVVITNVDGRDPADRSGCTRLSLEGQRTGEICADFFVATISAPAPLPAPELPFAIHPPATTQQPGRMHPRTGQPCA